jgi:GntR family transcriptional regulator
VKIDETSPEHSYRQLAELLRARIIAGEITTVLPSITELTEETGLAVGTVRRAIKILVDDGLVRTVPGRGTYVADTARTKKGGGSRPSGGRAAGQKGQDDPARPHGHVRH